VHTCLPRNVSSRSYRGTRSIAEEKGSARHAASATPRADRTGWAVDRGYGTDANAGGYRSTPSPASRPSCPRSAKEICRCRAHHPAHRHRAPVHIAVRPGQ
jgi:hypothetical protein